MAEGLNEVARFINEGEISPGTRVLNLALIVCKWRGVVFAVARQSLKVVGDVEALVFKYFAVI